MTIVIFKDVPPLFHDASAHSYVLNWGKKQVGSTAECPLLAIKPVGGALKDDTAHEQLYSKTFVQEVVHHILQ